MTAMAGLQSHDVDRRLMVGAIARGALAPSVHNTQPWIFRVTHEGIDVLCDTSRQLTVLDPVGREMFISCGAALLHVRLALEAAGRTPQVVLLPDADRADILARIVLGPAGPVNAHTRELDRSANSRQTNRRSFHGRLGTGVAGALQVAAESENAGLQEIVDESDRTCVKVWQQAADRAQITSPAYRRELRSWVNVLERPDGIPVDTTVEPARPVHDFAARDFAFDETGGLREELDDPHTAVFLLFTEDDGPRSWLEAGQALARLWLEATLLGLVLQPLSQSVEQNDTRLAMRSELRLLTAWPQLLLRVGRAAPQPRTRRRAVNDIIQFDWPEDPGPAGTPAPAGRLALSNTGQLQTPHST